MKTLNIFLRAVLAGLCIAIGGSVFLIIENPIIGSLLFTVGLFTICTNNFYLFTGKVGYAVSRPPSYLFTLLITWLGNLAGTALGGYALRFTRLIWLEERALTLCQAKLSDGLLSIFILSIFCNILMYVAIDGFQNNPHPIGKYIGLFLCVSVFILCGFEHCIANMFYFSIADVWSARALLYLAVMTLGNATGGILLPLANKLTVANK